HRGQCLAPGVHGLGQTPLEGANSPPTLGGPPETAQGLVRAAPGRGVAPLTHTASGTLLAQNAAPPIPRARGRAAAYPGAGDTTPATDCRPVPPPAWHGPSSPSALHLGGIGARALAGRAQPCRVRSGASRARW